MRDYGSVSPQFWIGATGKQLRGKPSAQIVALYLMTSPHANMIGVFHCPMLYVAHETGLSLEQAEQAFDQLESLDFCTYDRVAEVIFVHSMSAHQVGEGLKADDNKVKGVRKEWERITVASIKAEFARRYANDYHLPEQPEAPSKPLPRGQNTPSKQLTGTGQEQNQEQEQEQEQEQKPARVPRERITLTILDLEADGVDPIHARDWLKVRKKALTQTAWQGVKSEAFKAGITPKEAVRICATKSWESFDHSWSWPGKARASPASGSSDTTEGAALILGFNERDVIDA